MSKNSAAARRALSESLMVAVAICLISVTAGAQRIRDIESGTRIRITELQGRRLTGSFVTSTADSVRLIAEGSSMSISMPSIGITKFEVSTGRHRVSGALIKGGIGLVAGAAAGALVGSASFSGRTPECFFDCTRGQAASFGAFLGGGAGLLTGVVVGVVTGNESWSAIQFR